MIDSLLYVFKKLRFTMVWSNEVSGQAKTHEKKYGEVGTRV